MERPKSPVSIAEETDVLECSWKHSKTQASPNKNGEVYNRRPAQPNWGIGFLIEKRSQTDAFLKDTPVHNPGYEWLNRLCLPLYDSAQGKPWGVLTGNG